MSKAEISVKQGKSFSLRKCGGDIGGGVRNNLGKECLIGKSIFNYTGLNKTIRFLYKVDLHFLQNGGELIYK